MFRLFARVLASVLLPEEENLDGKDIPTTFSGPNASTAIHNVSAESIPPDNPMTTP